MYKLFIMVIHKKWVLFKIYTNLIIFNSWTSDRVIIICKQCGLLVVYGLNWDYNGDRIIKLLSDMCLTWFRKPATLKLTISEFNVINI